MANNATKVSTIFHIIDGFINPPINNKIIVITLNANINILEHFFIRNFKLDSP